MPTITGPIRVSYFSYVIMDKGEFHFKNCAIENGGDVTGAVVRAHAEKEYGRDDFDGFMILGRFDFFSRGKKSAWDMYREFFSPVKKAGK